jgi:hypothetical protein
VIEDHPFQPYAWDATRCGWVYPTSDQLCGAPVEDHQPALISGQLLHVDGRGITWDVTGLTEIDEITCDGCGGIHTVFEVATAARGDDSA